MDAAEQIKQANDTTAIFIAVMLIGLPFIVLLICFLVIRKCPKCGNRRNNLPAMQTVGTHDGRSSKHTSKQILVCGKCGHEF